MRTDRAPHHRCCEWSECEAEVEERRKEQWQPHCGKERTETCAFEVRQRRLQDGLEERRSEMEETNQQRTGTRKRMIQERGSHGLMLQWKTRANRIHNNGRADSQAR